MKLDTVSPSSGGSGSGGADTAAAVNLQQPIAFLHIPIPDAATTADDAVIAGVDSLCKMLLTRPTSVIYVHCKGGHGRTGTIVALVLCRLYGISAKQAVTYVQIAHYARKHAAIHNSPETLIQFAQVERIAGQYDTQRAANSKPTTAQTSAAAADAKSAVPGAAAGGAGRVVKIDWKEASALRDYQKEIFGHFTDREHNPATCKSPLCA